MKKNLHIHYDIPYGENIMKLMEYLTFSCDHEFSIDENSNDFNKAKHDFLIKEIKKIANKNIANVLISFKNDNIKKLNKNPLLLGLIETYIKTSNASTESQYKSIYDEYQSLQIVYPFEDNKQIYFDCGCMLLPSISNNDDELYVCYPIHLSTAYRAHGGNSISYDHINCGFLTQTHKLNFDELVELYNLNPKLFNKHAEKIYFKITKMKS